MAGLHVLFLRSATAAFNATDTTYHKKKNNGDWNGPEPGNRTALTINSQASQDRGTLTSTIVTKCYHLMQYCQKHYFIEGIKGYKQINI